MSYPRLIMTVLAVRDLDKSTRFYSKVFEWPPGLELPVVTTFHLPGGMELMLYQKDGFAANTGQDPVLPPRDGISGTELYLQVDDLSLMIQRIETAGARKLSDRAVRAWGDEVAYYADPDGNVIALAAGYMDE